MDSLVFEMHKQYHENKLQLLVSPIILYAHHPSDVVCEQQNPSDAGGRSSASGVFSISQKSS
jgi:hypothetical protein